MGWINLAETRVWQRSGGSPYDPKPCADLGTSMREADAEVISRTHVYQAETMPSDPNYFFRDPSAYFSSMRQARENDHSDRMYRLCPDGAITAREQNFRQLRSEAREYHRGIDAATKVYSGATATGHALGGGLFFLTFGMSMAASGINHGVQLGIMKAALNHMGNDARRLREPARNHAYEARLARSKYAHNIVKT